MRLGIGIGIPGGLRWWQAPPTDSLYLRLFAHESNFALSSGKITTWQGGGTSGLSAGQVTGAYQPSPGAGINGKTTVVFSGAQYLTVPNVALGVFDIYLVLKMSVWPKIVLAQGTNVYARSGFSLFSGQSTSTGVNHADGTGALTALQSYYPDWLPTNNTPHLVQWGHDGTHSGHLFKKDGSDIQQTTAYSSNNPGVDVITKELVIGGSGQYTSLISGEIGEILIYNGAPDADRAAKVLSYARQYWGTP